MLFLSLYRVCPSCSHGPFPCVLLLSITSLALAGLATEANPIQSLCVLCFSNLCCSTVNPSQRIAMMHECLCVFYLSNLLCSTVNPFQRIVMTHECLCVLCFSSLCCSTLNPFQRIAMTHRVSVRSLLIQPALFHSKSFPRIAMTHGCLCVLCFSNLCCFTVNLFTKECDDT